MDIDSFKKLNGYEISGLWYPRVTSICKIIAKPGLESWFAKQGSLEALVEKRKKITGFGSLIHDVVERILMGEVPSFDSQIAPSITAFYDWYRGHKVRSLDIERRVVSNKYTYAGNIDVLTEINGKFGILDIKTTDRFWDDQFIQTAAYFQAHNEGNIRKADTHWVLRIDQYEECRQCGAKRRDKGGELEIKGGDMLCNHNWSNTKGVCELKEVSDHNLYLEMFLTAKKLWELVNRDYLAKIENRAMLKSLS